MAERGQISLRPAQWVIEGMRDRARLAGQKPTNLAERYLAEGLAMDEHPGIHFVDGPAGRRPAVVGGPDVWQLVEVVRGNDGSVEAAAEYLEIDPRLINTALGYYGAHREEIDDWISRVHGLSEREEANWRAAREALAR